MRPCGSTKNFFGSKRTFQTHCRWIWKVSPSSNYFWWITHFFVWKNNYQCWWCYNSSLVESVRSCCCFASSSSYWSACYWQRIEWKFDLSGWYLNVLSFRQLKLKNLHLEMAHLQFQFYQHNYCEFFFSFFLIQTRRRRRSNFVFLGSEEKHKSFSSKEFQQHESHLDINQHFNTLNEFFIVKLWKKLLTSLTLHRSHSSSSFFNFFICVNHSCFSYSFETILKEIHFLFCRISNKLTNNK